MTGKTHLAFNTAIVASLFAAGITNIHNITGGGMAVIGGIVLGGILPDIDSPNSKIRHIIRRIIVPKGYRRLASRMAMSGSSFNHRKNCTHWPFFWLVTCAALYTCFIAVQPLPFFAIGLAAGTAAHLFCDMFNPYGIMLLSPFSYKKWSLAKIPTSSIGEMVFLLISILTAAILLMYAFKTA